MMDAFVLCIHVGCISCFVVQSLRIPICLDSFLIFLKLNLFFQAFSDTFMIFKYFVKLRDILCGLNLIRYLSNYL